MWPVSIETHSLGGEEGIEFWCMISGNRSHDLVPPGEGQPLDKVGIRSEINSFSAVDHRSGVFGYCEDWQDQM